jgi:hypothetical protein
MAASRDIQEGRWSVLSRRDLIAFGRRAATERLEEIGCWVRAGGGPGTGPLQVTTASGREIEVFVST